GTKSMNKKGFRALGLMMLAFVLVLTACAGNNKNAEPSKAAESSMPSGETTPSNDPVELSIMWWGTDARHEATLAALDIYSKQQTNITFKPEYVAWDAFWAKLPTLAASKSITDVLQMDAAYINEYVDKGTLADLSD